MTSLHSRSDVWWLWYYGDDLSNCHDGRGARRADIDVRLCFSVVMMCFNVMREWWSDERRWPCFFVLQCMSRDFALRLTGLQFVNHPVEDCCSITGKSKSAIPSVSKHQVVIPCGFGYLTTSDEFEIDLHSTDKPVSSWTACSVVFCVSIWHSLLVKPPVGVARFVNRKTFDLFLFNLFAYPFSTAHHQLSNLTSINQLINTVIHITTIINTPTLGINT